MLQVTDTFNAVIAQWIEDLLDPDFGVKFNAEFECFLDKKNQLNGDAALFLALRHVDVMEDADLIKWYATLTPEIPKGNYHASDYIVHKFTGIPIEDACQLMWPVVESGELDMAKIRAKEFVVILRNYLKTGEVCWSLLI